MPPFDPRGANEAGWPWEQDYRRVRPEYFDAADQRLMHLVDQGFTPCIVGAWGFYMPWIGEAKLKAHWRYLVARYAAWPVVWCAAGEANLPWYQANGFPYDDESTARRWCDVMRSIRAVDPWRRPLTVHPTAIHAFTARHVVDDPALLDFDLLQTPHDGPGMYVEAVTPQAVVHSRAAYALSPWSTAKPVTRCSRSDPRLQTPRHVLVVHAQRRSGAHLWRQWHLAGQSPRRAARPLSHSRQHRIRGDCLG